MSIEALTAAWIPQAMGLSAEAGWNQVAADWEVFVRHGALFGEIVEGRLVATAAALPFGDAFGWVSMVLTTPAHRGRGLARRLTAEATAVLREAGRTALLDATPAGAAVYGRLGFVPLCAMQRWQGAGGGLAAAASPPDLALDQAAFGADRSFLLNDILARPGTASFAAPDGFAVRRAGAIAAQIGPVVGDLAVAAAQVTEAVASATGRVFIDVLEAGYALRPLLASRGFTEQRGFARMALGHPVLPGDPTRLLAAASPEFG